MTDKITIREFLNATPAIQQDAFWDWFCERFHLPGKTKRLVKRLKSVLRADKGRKIDIDKTYVEFKNNMPLCGRRFDDIKILDIETKSVLYTIFPKRGFNDKDHGNAQVYGRENDFQEPLVNGTWDDVTTFFNGGIPIEKKPASPTKPKCKLIGEDGNTFNLCGIASATLKKAGQHDRAVEMVNRVVTSGSYEEALNIISDYVDIY